MRKVMLLGIGAALTAMVAMPVAANAQNRTVTGAAIGAGSGALIAGPPGAVVGGVAGGFAGNAIARDSDCDHHRVRHSYLDSEGHRHYYYR